MFNRFLPLSELFCRHLRPESVVTEEFGLWDLRLVIVDFWFVTGSTLNFLCQSNVIVEISFFGVGHHMHGGGHLGWNHGHLGQLQRKHLEL